MGHSDMEQLKKRTEQNMSRHSARFLLCHLSHWGPGGSPYFSLSRQEDRQRLTWVDVLKERFPDGVLQGARVLGSWEVFVR